MRVVIVTTIPFWHPGTTELIKHLRESNIQVAAIDYFNAIFIDEQDTKHELLPHVSNKLIKKILLKLMRSYFFKSKIQATDILDIHFVDGYYKRMLPLLSHSNKLIATLFGSDLFRSNDASKEMQKSIFERANLILMSDNMKPFFEDHFSGNSSKIYNNQYGSDRIDMVHSSYSESSKKLHRAKWGIADDKIVITCGYNAKEEQQHHIMIQQLDMLSVEDKSKLFLLFPLTYGRQENYLLPLRKQIQQLNIPYLLFEQKLSEEELVASKIVSDITLNTQTTDALASSIKEAFVAKNVLIVADWLPYGIYKELGLFYISSDQVSMANNIHLVINNMKKYTSLVEQNPEKIMTFASWKVLIPQWISMYKSL